MRLTTIIAAIGFACSAGSTVAQTLEKPGCTQGNIDSTDEKVAKMKDSRQKATAAGEIANARDALAKGDTDACQGHLLKASVQTK